MMRKISLFLIACLILIPFTLAETQFIFSDVINVSTAQNKFNGANGTYSDPGNITLTYPESSASGGKASVTLKCDSNENVQQIKAITIREYDCSEGDSMLNISKAIATLVEQNTYFSYYWNYTKDCEKDMILANFTKEQCLKTLDFERNASAIELTKEKEKTADFNKMEDELSSLKSSHDKCVSLDLPKCDDEKKSAEQMKFIFLIGGAIGGYIICTQLNKKGPRRPNEMSRFGSREPVQPEPFETPKNRR